MGYLLLIAPSTSLRRLQRAKSKFRTPHSSYSEKCFGLEVNPIGEIWGRSISCNYPPHDSSGEKSFLSGSMMRRRAATSLYSQPSNHFWSKSSLSWTRNKYNSENGKAYSNFGFACRSITSSREKDDKVSESNIGKNGETLQEKSIRIPASDDDRYYYLVKQKYSPSRHQKYRPNGADGTLEMTVSNKPLKERIIQSYTDIVAYFMPKGYPESVGKGYRNFAAGQMISMVLSSAGGVLSMQSLLCAIGIGATEALPLAATLNWVIKDGLGQLGGVIFASVVSNRFDADPKRWRMLASLSMDVASFIELLTPFFPGYFLPLASVANVGKNISFLAASASRAAIHKTFAVHENLADITAKTGSQCILGAMLGTGLGIATAAVIGDSYVHTFAAFSTFTALSLGSTYVSLKSAILPSLSIARLDVILQHHFIFELKDLQSDRNLGPSSVRGTLGRVYSDREAILNPADLAEREAFLGSRPVPGLPPLEVGADLTDAVRSETELRRLLEIFSEDQYIISIRTSPGDLCTVHLLLKEKASKKDLLLGLVHSFIVRYAFKCNGYKGASPIDLSSRLRRNKYEVMSESTYDILVHTRSLLHRGEDSVSDVAEMGHSEVLAGDRLVRSSGGEAKQEGVSSKNDRQSQSTSSISHGDSGVSNSKGDSIGETTVRHVLGSTWLVEELLLETRRARLEIKKD